jgi:hypothetical protein
MICSVGVDNPCYQSAFMKDTTLTMKNCKSVASALNNITALNLAAAIDNDKLGKK